MSVTPSRYLSALGNIFPFFVPAAALFIVVYCGCDKGTNSEIPREEFISLYAETIMLRRLYAGDSTAGTQAVDSMYRYRGVTGKQMKATVEWYAKRPREHAEILKEAAVLLEQRNADSVSAD